MSEIQTETSAFFFLVLHHLQKCTQPGNGCIIHKLMRNMGSVMDIEAKNGIGDQGSRKIYSSLSYGSNSRVDCALVFGGIQSK